MNKILGLLALGLVLMAPSAFADTLVNVPHPTAVWDSTTGQAYALGIPGQGQSGLSILPNLGGAQSWTGAQTFSGGLALTGGNVTSTRNVAIGTSTPSTVPLTIVGLGTTSPGTGGGYMCVDSAAQTYEKSTCP